MLSAGNPYVLPSVIVAAVAYLALSILTDLSVLVRVGVLVGVGIVFPMGLNAVLGGSGDEESLAAEEADDGPTDADDGPTDRNERSDVNGEAT
ncbi:hypothetical protein JCM18237_19300 [Halorubrum luteum]